MDPMKILVTGAHGFIGRHACRQFARRGFSVCGIGHGGWKPDEWRSWGLRAWHEADVCSASLQEFAQQPHTIVHCAGGGSVAFSLSDPLADFQRTVVSTAQVLDYIRVHSPGTRLVYPSSAGVYGSAESLPITERHRCAPVSPYGVHKWLAEQLIATHCAHFGAAACIVRFFSVYGCGLRKQLLWDGCRKLARGDLVFMGTGNEVRDWLHVEDAAELLRIAAEHAHPGCPVVNGGTGEGVSVRELLTQVSSHLRADAATPIFSEILRNGDPVAYIADATQAGDWGWKPTAHWRERVAEYVEWWKLEMGLELSRPVAAHA
jgi:UDP-glucose 4-epimerase